MPAFSIATPSTIKNHLQAIYASDEKCYALVKLDEIQLESDDEEPIILRNTCSVDADVALPLEVCVLGVTAEWLQQHAADVHVYLDDQKIDAMLYAEASAEGKATFEKLYSKQKQLKCLYLQLGVSFKIADDNHELVSSVVEPTITDVTDNEKSADTNDSSSSESDGVNEDSEKSSSEDSVATMEFAIRLPENQLNTCSVHAIYSWHDKWYVLADLTVDPRLDEFAEKHPEENGKHAIEQLYTVEADKIPASVAVYWVRYCDKGNVSSPEIRQQAGLVKVAVDGIDVPTSSYASMGEKADQTLKALYPHQLQIDPIYLADLDDEYEASFSIEPLDENSDEYQLCYRVLPNGNNRSLPEKYRISKFEDVYNNQNASSVTAPTIEELADGVDVDVELPASPVQSEPPVVEEPADGPAETVTAQSAPADECVSGMSSPCSGLFSPRTWYAAGITLFAAGIYVGMQVLEQSSDQQQGPRI